MIERVNRVRQAYRERRPSFGIYARIPSPMMMELLADAGLDFVRIDMSQDDLGIETVRDMIRAAHSAGITPFVRVPHLDPHLIGVILGMGALGIVVPEVQGHEDIEAAVRAAKMTPLGDRRIGITGVDGFGRVSAGEYREWAADNIMLAVQVETRGAVEDLDAVLANPGLDMVLGGRGTLAREYGADGRDDPKIIAIENRIMDAAKRAGKITSVTYFPLRDRKQADLIREWLARGMDSVCVGGDTMDIVHMYRNARRELAP